MNQPLKLRRIESVTLFGLTLLLAKMPKQMFLISCCKIADTVASGCVSKMDLMEISTEKRKILGCVFVLSMYTTFRCPCGAYTNAALKCSDKFVLSNGAFEFFDISQVDVDQTFQSRIQHYQFRFKKHSISCLIYCQSEVYIAFVGHYWVYCW